MASRVSHGSKQASHARAYDRLPIDAEVYFSADGRTAKGTVCNVSLGGWCVSSSTPVKPGTAMTLFATLPDHKEAVLVDDAKVCWTQDYDFGLAIRKIAPPDSERLRAFIKAAPSRDDRTNEKHGGV